MKSFIPLTLLAIGAAAVPLEKRDYATTTVVDVVIETVDVYTTVFVQPGDPRLNQNQQAIAQNLPASTSAQSSSSAVFVPEQNKQAAYVPPAPTSTPPPSSSPSPSPSATSSSAPAVVAAPQKLAVAPVQQAPAPVQQAPAPVQPAPVQQSSAPAANPPKSPGSTSGSGPSGGACGQVGGKCTAGDMTTYDGTVGPGSCGFLATTKTTRYVALAADMMGAQSNGNPYCERMIKISANGQQYEAMVTDKCPGCFGQSLDLSIDLFNEVFPTAGGTGRFHNIEWWFTT